MASVSYETADQHTRLQQAYDHLNVALFSGQLPACVITMQRKRGAHGYYCSERFVSRLDAAQTTDEIAINPETMGRDDLTILSTLAHEMCHLWQQHYGKPSRGAYHNKEWAQQMHAIGLQPMSVDKPGKETGQAVTHTIKPGDRFEAAAHTLLSTGYTLQWCDRAVAKPKASNKNKVVYQCPNCDAKVWGKPEMRVICGDCNEMLLQDGLLPDDV